MSQRKTISTFKKSITDGDDFNQITSTEGAYEIESLTKDI